MDNLTKKVILKHKKTFYNIAEYCSIEENRNFCSKEKNFVCKSALEVVGYRTNDSFNYCELYNELNILSINIGIDKRSNNYMNANYIHLAKEIQNNGSNTLKNFLKYNNIKFPERINSLQNTNSNEALYAKSTIQFNSK